MSRHHFKASVMLLLGFLLMPAVSEARDNGVTVRQFCKGNKIKDTLVPVILPGMGKNESDKFEILWGKEDRTTLYIFAPALECPLKITSRFEEFIAAGRHPEVMASEYLRDLTLDRYVSDRFELEKIEAESCERVGPVKYYDRNVAVWGDSRAGSLEGILNKESHDPVSDCAWIAGAFFRGLGFYTKSYEMGISIYGSRAALSVTGIDEDEKN